jgi:hypothetical protein
MNKLLEYASLRGTQITQNILRSKDFTEREKDSAQVVYYTMMAQLSYARHDFITRLRPLDEERKTMQQTGNHFWEDIERFALFFVAYIFVNTFDRYKPDFLPEAKNPYPIGLSFSKTLQEGPPDLSHITPHNPLDEFVDPIVQKKYPRFANWMEKNSPKDAYTFPETPLEYFYRKYEFF